MVVFLATAAAVAAFLVGTSTGQMMGVGYGMLIASAFVFFGILLGADK